MAVRVALSTVSSTALASAGLAETAAEISSSVGGPRGGTDDEEHQRAAARTPWRERRIPSRQPLTIYTQCE